METLLDVRGLTKHFPMNKSLLGELSSRFQKKPAKILHAVDNVSLFIKKSETLGLVGESGSGKSTLTRCLVRIVEPTSGKILFNGSDVMAYNEAQLRDYRKHVQIVFQDPFSSLNPRMKVGQIIGHRLELHKITTTPKETRSKAIELLELVGLKAEHLERYPHQFSGGQRQRIGIARALAVNPDIVLLDEPVSALDVSIQAQVLNLLVDLRNQFGLSYLFVSHDLRVIKHVSDRVAVMYLGKVVELAKSADLFGAPRHPYTQALMSSAPSPKPGKAKRILLIGEIPSPIDLPSGCRFRTRCPWAQERCASEEPALVEKSNGHSVACHYA